MWYRFLSVVLPSSHNPFQPLSSNSPNVTLAYLMTRSPSPLFKPGQQFSTFPQTPRFPSFDLPPWGGAKLLDEISPEGVYSYCSSCKLPAGCHDYGTIRNHSRCSWRRAYNRSNVPFPEIGLRQPTLVVGLDNFAPAIWMGLCYPKLNVCLR